MKRRDEFKADQVWYTSVGSRVTILEVFPYGPGDGTLMIRYVYKDGSEFTRNAAFTSRWTRISG